MNELSIEWEKKLNISLPNEQELKRDNTNNSFEYKYSSSCTK